jgi:queuine/archaeosine tRNA-ribosyltransferase
MKKNITKLQASNLGKKLKINYKVVPFNDWHNGLNIELEHSNITNGSQKLTAKIVIAHLNEFPDYYRYLKKMEIRREKFWKNKVKPSVFKTR